jgi:hypothetical protein
MSELSASHCTARRLARVSRKAYQAGSRSGCSSQSSSLNRRNWCLPVDAGVSRPERDLSRVRVDQPVVFVIGLVSQRVGDLFKIEVVQVQHRARIDLPRYQRSSTGTPDQRHHVGDLRSPAPSGPHNA